MAEAYYGLLIDSFLDGRDRRILSVHQHFRSQEEEVVMVAGVDVKVGIHLSVYQTLHRYSRDNESQTQLAAQCS